jgi:hypothetical protein
MTKILSLVDVYVLRSGALSQTRRGADYCWLLSSTDGDLGGHMPALLLHSA